MAHYLQLITFWTLSIVQFLMKKLDNGYYPEGE
jgi:hypothetical protein